MAIIPSINCSGKHPVSNIPLKISTKCKPKISKAEIKYSFNNLSPWYDLIFLSFVTVFEIFGRTSSSEIQSSVTVPNSWLLQNSSAFTVSAEGKLSLSVKKYLKNSSALNSLLTVFFLLNNFQTSLVRTFDEVNVHCILVFHIHKYFPFLQCVCK